MVWGMIGPEGGIAFCKVDGTLNSDYYINSILKEWVFANETLINKEAYF